MSANVHRLAKAAAVLLTLLTVGAAPAADLARDFAAPPAEARPWVYWFWLNGNITREGITADLEAMQRVGIAGVLIMEVDQGTPPGPARFADPAWRALFKHVVAEAGRLGLQVNMNNDAGWCGSGGPWITPDLAMQKVVWSEERVRGPRRLDETFPRPQAVADYYRDIAVLAFPTPRDLSPRSRIEDIQAKAAFVPQPVPLRAEWPALPASAVVPRDRVVDLTAHLDGAGRLTWDVPEGDWTILRFGHTPTGKDNHPAPAAGRGLECDKLNPEAVEAHFNGLMARLADDAGPLAGKTLVATHIDSWEVGSQNWTPRFREEFRKRRGYDPLPYLSVLTGRVLDSLEISERFLWDVRWTVSDLVIENYAGHMHELAHRRGLRLSIEAYDGCPCDDMAYAGQADEPMAEFWSWGVNTAYSCTEMASAAHVYGKPVLGAEAFTATDGERWQHHPASIKALGDWAFCEGINRFVFHRYALQPWPDRRPGMSMGPWGLHYERTQTWWEQSRPWHEYLARCQYLLRQGLFVADVCYLEPENAPQRFQPPLPGRQGNTPDRPGYNFDGCTPEVVLTRLTVKDGRLVLPDGMSYRLLVLSPAETMTPALLRKVKELVEAGATVVGAPPVKSPSLADNPRCDAEVKDLAEQLWGDADGKAVTEHRCGRGRVVFGKTAEEVLAAMGVGPDFTSGTHLRYTHRALGDTDIYFVANPTPQDVETVCTFRVSGKSPELWWPETGRVEPAAAYEEMGGRVTLPLRLGPSESVLVLFRRGAESFDPVVAVTRDGRPVLPPSGEDGKIIIHKAVYGVPGDPGRIRDVRARVQELVDGGEQSFRVARLAEGGDPAYGVVKSLVVEYTVAGRRLTATGRDPDTISLAGAPTPQWVADVRRARDGRLLLEAWQPGHYEVKTAAGRTHRAEVTVPPLLDVAGPWEVRFAPGWGAPSAVRLEKLTSWSEHSDPGVRYFSGTATYRKTLAVPAEVMGPDRRVFLDLGNVQVIAEVHVNGRDLGTLWKPPYRVDVTDVVHAGDNALQVKVTKLSSGGRAARQWTPKNQSRGRRLLQRLVRHRGRSSAAADASARLPTVPALRIEGCPRPPTFYRSAWLPCGQDRTSANRSLHWWQRQPRRRAWCRRAAVAGRCPEAAPSRCRACRRRRQSPAHGTHRGVR
jgi:hypothetical protein